MSENGGGSLGRKLFLGLVLVLLAGFKFGLKKFIIKAAVVVGLMSADALVGIDSTAAAPEESIAAEAEAGDAGEVTQAGAPQAGVPGAAAKGAARRGVDSANAAMARRSGDTLTPRGAGATQAGARATSNLAVRNTAVVMREVYIYDDGGRRDPFLSLMRTAELRPALQDLRLTGILFDQSGRRPVAIMREAGTNQQFRVTTGMSLGRMRVEQIRPKSVIFVIEEFGFSRRDSLVLVDSTRMRIQ